MIAAFSMRPAAGSPSELTDIHSHVVPALDDGPETLDESLALLRQAYDRGTRTIVATPHLFLPQFDYPPRQVRRRFASLCAALAERSADPRYRFLSELNVCLGAENHVSPDFFRALESESAICLNDTRSILVEFPMEFGIDEMRHAITRVRYHALIPVLAHVERYPAVQERPEVTAEFSRMRCVFQLNAESLLVHGPPKRTALRILGMPVHVVVASDAHHPHLRPTRLAEAAEAIERRFSVDRAIECVDTHPSLLLGRRRQQDPSHAGRRAEDG